MVGVGPFRDLRMELVDNLHAAGKAGEGGLGGPGRCAHLRHQRRPLGVAADGDGDPAVVAAARKHAVRCGRRSRMLVALGFAGATVEGVVHIGWPHHLHHRFLLREVDVLAFAAVAPMRERGEDGEAAEDAGKGVGIGVLDRDRGFTLVAHQAIQAGERGQAEAVGAHMLEWPVEPGGRHRKQDDVGLDRAQRFVADAQTLHHAGAEVLDHDVGLGNQPQRQRKAFGVLEVERHRTVAGPARMVGQAAIRAGNAFGEGRQVACHVDARARLDLEHFGTQKAQGLADHRSGPDPAEIDDANALQGERVGHGLDPVSIFRGRRAPAGVRSRLPTGPAGRRRLRGCVAPAGVPASAVRPGWPAA